jgi:hypothetical protein
MLNEFLMNTQRFGVKTLREPVCDNEAMVKFKEQDIYRNLTVHEIEN